MTLFAVLGKYDRKLRRYCRKQLRQATKGASAVWVTDNFRLLSSSLITAKGYASRKGMKALLPLFLMCKKFFSHSFILTEERIIAYFSAENLSISECEALSVMLFAGAAAAVCDCLPDGEDELVPALIKNLLRLREIDFEEILNNISRTEKYLLEDPAGIYEKMSPSSKKQYRSAVRTGARREGFSEKEYARRKLNEARNKGCHIGFVLPVGKSPERTAVAFMCGEWLLALLLSLAAAIAAGKFYMAFIFVFPFYAIIKPFTDRLSARLFPPFMLPSMKDGEETDKGVIITVSSLLPGADECDRLYSHLSALRSGVSLKNIRVLLLADKKNFPTPEASSDNADLEAAAALIDRLNEDFGGGFVLAVRDRVYSSTENEYTGFERKRGAIGALVKYLRSGDVNGFSLVHGDIKGLPDMKYMLALDSDTRLSFETLRRLVAAAEHPLNTPVFSPEEKRIVSGYGIITPRIETTLDSASRSLFSGIFTNGGSLSYAPRVNERYADMFGESVFSGKGLINIDAFNLCCADKFENGRILSHDILEGAVLRTGFLSLSEFTDSFPRAASGYYSRLHRWIRGDIQNLKYIFSPLGNAGDSPSVPALGKYQLFDNFRRAVSPVISFILAVISLFAAEYKGLLLSISVLSVISEFLPDIIFALSRLTATAFASLYLSGGISGVNKAFIRAGLSVGAMPVEAYVRTDAVVKALFRCLISKKHLLQWKTAAQADNEKAEGFIVYTLIPVLWAIILFIAGGSIHRLAAVFALFFAVFVHIKSNPFREKARKLPTAKEREEVLAYARESWRFFSENVTASENFLPPDNIQEAPVFKKAHRTSPTNAGLYLVSILAAADMSFISADEMIKRVNDTLDTIERLPKYRGLLYNWYDTLKALPVRPYYISSVDCGNFLVCLTALKEGLREYGFGDTVKRIEKMLEQADISFLYDKRRELFRIGFDVEAGSFSDSFYDLYMSEARMTSYLACASGRVPAAHWEVLDRSLKRSSFYVTPVSWTGTMFEYFMPALFLAHPEGSFAREGLRVALFTQKKYAARRGIPYGISESCYSSFDNALNYRYKAHGIRKLALKRDADEEAVVSPYSTFLTLILDKKAALKNLRLLEGFGARGKYGFCEAVDFCKKHLDGEHYAPVRTFMSHHIGMSLVAMANFLYDDAFVKRFMGDRKMSAASGLLEERLPVHPDISVYLKEKAEGLFRREISTAGSRSAPEEGSEVFAYTNGEITLMCDRYGRNRSFCSFSELTKLSSRSEGISIAVEEKGKYTVLFPDNDGGVKLKKYCALSEKNGDTAAFSAALFVHPSEKALLFPVKVKNNGDSAGNFGICWYAEPLLQKVFVKDMHPAFSDMFLKFRYDEDLRAAVFSRASDECFPCLAFGLYGKDNIRVSSDRESLLGTDADRATVFDNGFSVRHSTVRGVNPVLSISTDVAVRSGKSAEAVLIAAVGSDEEDALSTLNKVRKKLLPAVNKGAAAAFLRDKITLPAAYSFLSEVFFRGERGEIARTAASALKNGREALWELGISGDIPVITVFADRSCPETVKKAYITLYKRLRRSSLPADLVFIFENSADYNFSGDRELAELLRREGLYDMLYVKGGIHIHYLPVMSHEGFTALMAFSGLVYPESNRKASVFPRKNTEILSPAIPFYEENGFREGGYFINHHPSLPWCHTLSNKTFGTLVTDRSIGFTWCGNSRQNKLTPWSNDTASGLCGERIFIRLDGKIYDPVKNAGVLYTAASAVYASVFEDMRCTVTVEVPERGNRKRISVELSDVSGDKRECEIMLAVVPVLGEGGEGDFIRVSVKEDGVYAENPLNTDFKGIMCVYGEGDGFLYGDRLPFYASGRQGLLVVSEKAVINKSAKHRTAFGMCFSADEGSVRRLKSTQFAVKKNQKQIFNTGYAYFDEFACALLLHQVRDTRIQARCGFYQCSGAIGFRDQLQDSLALINRENKTVRQMIYRCASAQFFEGDVLHWFHPVYRKGLIYKGVRTRISDDLLWLPYTVARYISATGDSSILEKPIPYLEGKELADGIKDEYREFIHGAKKESVYMHCLRAINKALPVGTHSLPLIGTGDWNDSFDKIGEQGFGESVWLGMFLKKVCSDFAEICSIKNDPEVAQRLRAHSEKLSRAVDGNAFNGKWYTRAFYDDGEVLGDEGSGACEIDLLCQSWSSLADMPDKKRVKSALMQAYERLFDKETGVVKLFSPPFNEKSKLTGYVNRYPEGMRENGGQYTHAAVWFCMALFREGLIPQAESVLRALIPSEKYTGPAGECYKTEPYALAGDVYSAKGHEGRGGWSLYTGSAGWLLQLADRLSEDRKQQKIL